jgi:hypothetical protein
MVLSLADEGQEDYPLYNKLFTKILDSSIWMEDHATVRIWMTLLASMDEEGFCSFASPANLAHRARVTLDEVSTAIGRFEAPDAFSSDPEHEGKRVERVPGGWFVRNAKKYRNQVTREEGKRQNRERAQRFRERSAEDGYVYYARSTTKIRIAFGKNPWARISEMRRETPDIVLIGKEPGTTTTERERHYQFKHLLIEGEWFKAEKELEDYVATLVVTTVDATVATTQPRSNGVVTQSETETETYTDTEAKQLQKQGREAAEALAEETLQNAKALAKSSKKMVAVAPLWSPPPWLDVEAWEAYDEMRKKLKKPMTARARELVVKKLAGFEAEGLNTTEVLNQAVVNGWTDVYAPKQPTGVNHGKRSSNRDTDGNEEVVRRVLGEFTAPGGIDIGIAASLGRNAGAQTDGQADEDVPCGTGGSDAGGERPSLFPRRDRVQVLSPASRAPRVERPTDDEW